MVRCSHHSSAGVDGLSSAGAGGGAGAATDRNALFVRFKREVNDGLTLNAVVKEREAQLKDIKVAIKVGCWHYLTKCCEESDRNDSKACGRGSMY